MMARNVNMTFDQWILFPAVLLAVISNLSIPFLLLPGSGINGGRGVENFRTSWGIGGISDNDGNSGREGVTSEDDPCVCVPAATLCAPC